MPACFFFLVWLDSDWRGHATNVSCSNSLTTHQGIILLLRKTAGISFIYVKSICQGIQGELGGLDLEQMTGKLVHCQFSSFVTPIETRRLWFKSLRPELHCSKQVSQCEPAENSGFLSSQKFTMFRLQRGKSCTSCTIGAQEEAMAPKTKAFT